LLSNDDKKEKMAMNAIPLKRVGERTKDIANLAGTFLLSLKKSSWMTGQVLGNRRRTFYHLNIKLMSEKSIHILV
jgi:NAD(P)-dependent dehydrogenase (short-subunit alcohol dehydrogenase family)